MNREMVSAVDEIARQNGLQRSHILAELETALHEAYEQAHPGVEIEGVRVHPTTGDTEILYDGTWLDTDFSEGELGRISASAVRRSLTQYLDHYQNKHIIEYYEPLIGTVVSGRVKHSDRRGTWVKMQDSDGWVPARERHQNERLQRGQVHGFVVLGVQERGGRGEVLLSRKDERLVPGLLALHVPEVESGLIRVRAHARTPGERSLLVLEGDDGIAIIPTVRGVFNNRLRAIRTDLGREMLDFVVYRQKDDLQDFIRSLWMPTRPASFEYDEEEDGHIHDLKVYVYEDDLERAKSLAPLVSEILDASVSVDLAQKITKARTRPMREDLRGSLCSWKYTNGKQCVNQAISGSDRCQTHQT